uniref:Apolipoprotein M n=1 Tax=Astatotilapia calliptera TaxID=8154 RepID=A0A3P8P0J2_ASTCA
MCLALFLFHHYLFEWHRDAAMEKTRISLIPECLPIVSKSTSPHSSFSDPAHLKFFKLRDSSSIHFSNTNVTSNVSYTPSVYYGGECHHKTHSVSLDGSMLNFDEREQVNLTLTFLFTSCSDCLVMRFDNESKKIERLLLFSKRRAAEPEELEEYRVQARCLNLLPTAVMDPTKELCQGQSAQTEREQQA